MRRVLARIRLGLGRLIQEARDPWVIALVEVTGVATYVVAAASLWQAIAAAAAVLLVRVLVGLARPVPGYSFDPLSVLTRRELEIAIFVCRRLTVRQIGSRLGLGDHSVKNRIARIMRKLDVADSDELRDLVGARIRDVPAQKSWYERSIVRGTLAAGGFVGFAWTSYQIALYVMRVMGAVP
jgi:DNA-binding CsgD family transcriptional regulator